MHIIELECDYT